MSSVTEHTVLEHYCSCPFCAESISLLLDLSAGNQSYVEDCQVCCQPMQVTYEVLDTDKVSVQIDSAA